MYKLQLALFAIMSAMASAFVQPSASWVTRAAPVSAMPQMDFAASSMFEATSSFADSSTALVNQLPMAVSLEVTFAAYLAILLGTLLPVLFLVVLYLNSEARKIGDFREEENL